jgi:nucleotide-binding universal stress UspA family protein
MPPHHTARIFDVITFLDHTFGINPKFLGPMPLQPPFIKDKNVVMPNDMNNSTEIDPFAGRIVVGMDGSDGSLKAAKWAEGEAKLRGRGITLTHAIMPMAASSAFGVAVPPRLDLIEDMRISAFEDLTRAAADLDCTDVDVVVEIGTPAALLLAASDSAELLVLGSRGRGGFTSLLLGSVGSQVASHAGCPVIVMRNDPRAGATEILVGLDGSQHSIAALDFAFDEASRHGYTLVAVHAWDVPSFDLIITGDGSIPLPMEHVADEEVRLSAEILAGYTEQYPEVKVVEHLIRAPAVRALLDSASNAAMIVLGTRGRNAAVGALLGSTSNGVLHKAKIPVAIIPLPPEEMEAA